MVGQFIEIIRKQARVDVERHGCAGMTQLSLNHFDGGSSGDHQ